MACVQTKRGFGLIEVVIAAALISLVIGALVSTTGYFLKTSITNTSHVQAGYLLEEGAEALKFMRDEGWTAHIASLTNGTAYYYHWTGSRWTATTSSSTIDSTFSRTFVVGSVYRDGNDDIASSGILDTGTRKATITVSWIDTAKATTTSKSLVMYIADLFDN